MAQLFMGNEEIKDEILEEEIENEEELEEEVEEEETEDLETQDDEDDFEKIFDEKEDISIDDIDLSDLDGYSDNEETYKAVAKKFLGTGVPKEVVKPLIKEFGQIIDNIENEYNKPIQKEEFLKLDPESRKQFRVVNEGIKQNLSKDELDLFRKMFNTKEKIELANKMFGKKEAGTGKTDYENDGRKPVSTDVFEAFEGEVLSIASKFRANPVKQDKAMKELFKKYANTKNNAIKDYIKEY